MATAPTPERLAAALLFELELKGENLELHEDKLAEMGVFDHRWISRDDWKALGPILAEEYDRRAKDRIRANIQNVVREKVIYDWLTQHTPVKGEDDCTRVKNTIERCMRADRQEEITEYLADLVTGGIELG